MIAATRHVHCRLIEYKFKSTQNSYKYHKIWKDSHPAIAHEYNLLNEQNRRQLVPHVAKRRIIDSFRCVFRLIKELIEFRAASDDLCGQINK